MSTIYSSTDEKITRLIFEKPELISGLLKKHGYKSKDITSSVFKAIYNDKNEEFIKGLDYLISNDGYATFEPISMGVSAALSIGSALLGNSQAKKALALQRKIALAQLSTQKMIEEERIRTGAETERTRILIQSLQQYQSDLQKQSTQRLKDSWVYIGILGVSVAIIYGVSILLTSKSE